jgi:small-conductance mechanosensitive channel
MRDHLTQLLESWAQLFDVKSIEAMGLRVFGAALILLAGFWISKMLQRFLIHRLHKSDREDDSAIGVYQMIIRVVTFITAASLALHTLGIDLTHLFTTGGLLAVAAAFAMKTAAENFIAGLVIRVENEFKPGDVLAMSDGSMFKVKKIGLRATIVRSKAEGDLIVPNIYLIQNVISNYTYRDSLHRIETEVGISYDSDLKRVKEILEHVCHNLEWRSRQLQPLIILDAFGDSSVNYKIHVWIEDPWRAGRLRGQLNESIWWELKEAGIVIPYPQRDVHFIQESPMPTPADIS